MALYLGSFWNAGFWSFFLIGMIAAAFKLARFEFDSLLGAVLGVGVWLCLLLAARRRLISLDVEFGRRQLAQFNLAQEPSQMLALGDQDLADVLTTCLARSLARTLATPASFSIRQIRSGEFRAVLNHAEESIQLWYVPVQALVWTLPALGFAGTAWKMRSLLLELIHIGAQDRAISIDTLASYGPSLGMSLLIICVALALSALFYLGVSLVFQRDLHALADIKAELALRVARARTPRVTTKRDQAQY